MSTQGGNKLLQYRTSLYKECKAYIAEIRAAKSAHLHSSYYMKWLAKTGYYKRKLRQEMDRVEIALYGNTRKQLKKLYHYNKWDFIRACDYISTFCS